MAAVSRAHPVGRHVQLGARLSSVTFLTGGGIATPLALSMIQPVDMKQLCAQEFRNDIIRSLRGISDATFATASPLQLHYSSASRFHGASPMKCASKKQETSSQDGEATNSAFAPTQTEKIVFCHVPDAEDFQASCGPTSPSCSGSLRFRCGPI